MATAIPNILALRTTNGVPSLSLEQDYSQVPNSSYAASQIQKVNSLDQLKSLGANLSSDYQNKLSLAQGAGGRSTDPQVVAALQSSPLAQFNNADKTNWTPQQYLENLQKAGYFSGDLNQALTAFNGGFLDSGYVAGGDTFGGYSTSKDYAQKQADEAAFANGSKVKVMVPGTDSYYAVDAKNPQAMAQAQQTAGQLGSQAKNGVQTVGQQGVGQPENQVAGSATSNPVNPAQPLSTGVQPAQAMGNMTTASLTDYLASLGQSNDLTTRANLAVQHGLVKSAQDYLNLAKSGANGQINTQLLSQLRSQTGASGSSVSAPIAPPKITPVTVTDQTGNTQTGFSTGNTQLDTLLNKAGITPDMLQSAGYKSPQNATVDYYSQAYNSLGLSTIKQQYEDQTKAYTDLQNKKADEITAVNNDPWLSEGVRQRTVDRINSKYEQRENTLSNQLKLSETMYQQGQDQAQFVATQALNASHDQAVLDQNMLFKAIDISEKQAEASSKLDSGIVGEYQFAVQNGYKGSFSQYQNEDANRKEKATGVGGLTMAQINTTVNQIAGSFDNEPIVKNFNTLNEGYNFAKGLSNTTTNPADDQGLIYAFAKAMDPGSVVREGEYATVQKYAQSLIQSYGQSVNQAIAGTGFLSEDARKNIKATIEAKYANSLGQYQALKKQYDQRIADAKAGKGNSITDYSSGYGSPSIPPNPPVQPVDEATWLKAPYDYTTDIKLAKEAIAQGADPAAVKARLLKKYKEVNL